MGTLNLLITILLLNVLKQSLAIDIWGKDKEYDFIVVGAGAAGGTLASRLSEESKFNVLLLEAGGETHYFNKLPYFAPGPFAGELDWGFITEPQKHACLALLDEKWMWARGKGLGGSTLINSMIYNRGDPKDYDAWERLGNDGWGFDDVLPYFKKLEDYKGPIDEKNEKYHSFGGPISASRPPYETEIANLVIKGGEELGYSEVDYNGESIRGFSKPMFTLKNGSRHSVYEAYIHEARKRSNLEIVTGAFVEKVEFEEKFAEGVIFEREGKLWRAKAKKEIIISGGAVTTPQILLLSGVGDQSILQQFNIPVVKHLPGVGNNLQDHISVTPVRVVLNSDIGLKFTKDVNPQNFELWELKGEGPLTVPFTTEGIAFIDTEYSDKTENWPDMEILTYNNGFKLAYKQIYEPNYYPPEEKNFLYAALVLLRPKSVGYITIKSKDFHVSPVFIPNYLSNEDDVRRLASGIKIFLNLTKTKPFQKYEPFWDHFSPIKGCEQFDFMSDKYLECFVRYYSIGFYHQCCTAKMGPEDDPSAVVDNKLRVHGVKKLRVADMSVPPNLLSSHTMIPSIMIGEKAADIIKNDWAQRPGDEL